MAVIEARGQGYRARGRIKGFTPQSAAFVRLTDARRWARRQKPRSEKGDISRRSKQRSILWRSSSIATSSARFLRGSAIVEERKRPNFSGGRCRLGHVTLRRGLSVLIDASLSSFAINCTLSRRQPILLSTSSAPAWSLGACQVAKSRERAFLEMFSCASSRILSCSI